MNEAATGPLRVLAQAGHFPDWLKTGLAQKLQVTTIDVQTYATPEEAAAALATPHSPSIDLALVPDRILLALIHAQALRPLPAERGIKPDHLYLGHYFDRDNCFAWPYALNLVAIAYNAHAVKSAPQHWSDLTTDAAARRTFFLDPAIIPALDRKARSGTDVGHASPPAAAETGAAYLVGAYGELRRHLAAQADWKYVLPSEGTIIVLDHLVLPAAGKNSGAADNAIALFMDPAATARLDSENLSAVTQKEALPQVPADLLHDPLLYPTAHLLNNCVFAKPKPSS